MTDKNNNTGTDNPGYRNSGNGNSGYGNSGSRETGIFNTTQGKIRLFNKETDLTWKEIDHPHFEEFYLNKWIPEGEMTDEEKKKEPGFHIRKGYLKTYSWEDAWTNFWRDTDEENRQKVLDLPNFSWEIFTLITGIEKEDKKTVDTEIEVNGVRYRKVDD